MRNDGNSSELLGSSVLPLLGARLSCGMARMADLCGTESFIFFGWSPKPGSVCISGWH